MWPGRLDSPVAPAPGSNGTKGSLGGIAVHRRLKNGLALLAGMTVVLGGLGLAAGPAAAADAGAATDAGGAVTAATVAVPTPTVSRPAVPGNGPVVLQADLSQM